MQTLKMRYYTSYECQRLSIEARGMLHSLEQNGTINPELRENIIDHALDLKIDMIELDHLTWIILVELLKQGNKDAIQNALFQTSHQSEFGVVH
jgi:Smg protein